jgi:SAM-dependent methyltransferase
MLLVLRHPVVNIKKLSERLLWQISVPISLQSENTVHVDLGSGNVPRNPFGASKVIGTDFHSDFVSPSGFSFVQVDLTKKLPFEDSTLDSVSAYDVLEHIPRWERIDGKILFPFIDLMSEIHRCLKPGGTFLAVTPAFPSPAAFQDPTHVNIISTVTVKYFTNPSPWAGNLEYGFIGNFDLVCQTWLRGNSVLSAQTASKNQIKSGARIFLLPKNLRLLFQILVKLVSKKPTHLLWVLSKPTL